jgi:hypothetical protein
MSASDRRAESPFLAKTPHPLRGTEHRGTLFLAQALFDVMAQEEPQPGELGWSAATLD